MHVLHVVGARPNFMKAAPVIRSLTGRNGIQQTLVHTGQHYDANMSEVFFKELNIPAPDINLQVGTGSHAQQTATIMSRFEPVLTEARPDVVVVYGDVNSTVAAALVCAKLGVPVAHVEAGLRSYDRTMPEEINRILTDQMSTLLFTPSLDGNENLANEGIAPEKVHLVGNVMIDTLMRLLPEATKCTFPEMPDEYLLVTMHRPGNVDDPVFMYQLLDVMNDVAQEIAVIFPVHPRTACRFKEFGLNAERIRFLNPLSYIDFLALQSKAKAVITDSGGIQEETTFLGVPCLTLRENTERPITITMGTNRLIGRDTNALRVALSTIGEVKQPKSAPPLWDGHTGKRIANILMQKFVADDLDQGLDCSQRNLSTGEAQRSVAAV